VTAPASASEILPLDEVRPGMSGVGRTVFEGTRIEEFQVEILGVMQNTGPRRNLILARLEGGPLAETGVIAGMSGSPVLIDGKLVGAVAYGYPFSKETIAGITPIAEMLRTTQSEAPRAASARFPLSLGRHGLKMPLDREAFVAAVARSLPSVTPLTGSLPTRLVGASLQPLPLPLVFSGFDASAFQWAREVFAPLGFTPVMGSGARARDEPEIVPFEPGGAVGVSLIEGDLDVSVTGTITHIDGDRVYAFGHPFYNLGPTQFPMKTAYVYSVFPSLYQSWKIAAAREAVGTVEQDRTAAIAGRLGDPPAMIPLEVRLTTSRGQQRSYSLRIVEDELFSPVLAYMALASVLQADERAYGTSTIRVAATLRLEGGERIEVEDLYTQNQPALRAATLVAAPMAYLMANDIEKVRVASIDIELASQETVQSATLERAWIERSGPVRPGSELTLRLQLRTYRGDAVGESIAVEVPETADAGRYTLLVADGASLTQIEQREMRQPFVPRNISQLIRAINALRRSNHVYARLLKSEAGAVIAGEYMQSLPPSVLSVLGAAGPGAPATRLRTSSIWDHDQPTGYSISGLHRLPIVVEP
jgi:hypothetical protein